MVIEYDALGTLTKPSSPRRSGDREKIEEQYLKRRPEASSAVVAAGPGNSKLDLLSFDIPITGITRNDWIGVRRRFTVR
jgi:hypothetical protein